MAKKRANWHSKASRTVLHGDWCVYCGMLADTQDHFPPISLTSKGLLLPCCRECNSLAGTSFGSDFYARSQLVKKKLAQRNRKSLKVAEWSADELDEIGPMMKKEVKTWQERRRIIHSRLAWNAESYLASIDKHSVFADLIAECVTTIELEQKLTDDLEQKKLIENENEKGA